MTDLVFGIVEFDVELGHGVTDRLKSLDDVVEDDGLPFELFVFAEALGVDEFHLLENRGFSGFSGAYRIAKWSAGLQSMAGVP